MSWRFLSLRRAHRSRTSSAFHLFQTHPLCATAFVGQRRLPLPAPLAFVRILLWGGFVRRVLVLARESIAEYSPPHPSALCVIASVVASPLPSQKNDDHFKRT